MEGLYKKKKNGLGERAVRARVKETSSKNKRANLLATKRKIPRTPLGVLEFGDEKLQQKQTVAVQSPANQMTRLEKLKEWKKKKDEARAKKEKENAKKPPPFRCGQPIQTKPEATAISKQHTNGPKSAEFTIGTFHEPNLSQPSASYACTTFKNSKPEAPIQPSIPTTRNRSKTSKNPSVATRTSSRLAAKEESSKRKQATNRSQNRSVTKSTRVIKTAGVGKKSPTQRKTNTRSRQASSSKTKSTKTIEKITPEEVEMEEVPQRVKPTTPAKSHLPVTPSPLLKSQRPKIPKITFVNHPAWIPNALLSPSLTGEPNFDATFNNPLSPFQFTAGTINNKSTNNQQYAFTFKKEMPSLNISAIHLSDSLQEDESTSSMSTSENERVTPNPKLVRKSLSKSHSSKKSNRHITNCEDDLVVQVLDMDSEDPIASIAGVEMVPAVLECEQEKEQVDVAYFRGLYSDVVEKLTEPCQVWDQKALAFEQEETDDNCNNKEEVLGQIRTTVCQAQLLMRQKLKQYLRLVDDAEMQRGERKTTAEDLQGFWDMVYFQVEDMYKKFDGLMVLENNGWEHKLPTPKKPKGKKRQTTTKKSVSTDDSNNARLQAAREKREAERNRLREMRIAAKRARQEGMKEPVVEDQPEPDPQVTPKKAKTVRTPRTRSSSRRSRRRSQRLMMKSVFSPTARVPSPCHMVAMDIPTAMLLDL